MRVSVVIPVKDDDRVFRCVDSVLACAPGDEGGAIEVIVVDNGSGAAFQERLGELKTRVEVISLEQAGVYAARNAGVSRASGDVILFTDADCVVDRDWVAAALRGFATGAEILQGHSGAIGGSACSRLIQARYSAHLRKTVAGEGTECDTRNLAVLREVFDRLRFNESFRRVGDTEFGLAAEAIGFRVAYWPAMGAEHDHETDLRLFAAKQVCHGWGAQRLMRDPRRLRWHGGHARIVSRCTGIVAAVPPTTHVGRWLAATSIGAAGILERRGARLPFAVSLVLLGILDKASVLAGHLLYTPGAAEPSPSELLGRQLPRD